MENGMVSPPPLVGVFFGLEKNKKGLSRFSSPKSWKKKKRASGSFRLEKLKSAPRTKNGNIKNTFIRSFFSAP